MKYSLDHFVKEQYKDPEFKKSAGLEVGNPRLAGLEVGNPRLACLEVENFEDRILCEMAKEAKKEGYIGTEESEELIKKLQNENRN